MAYTPTYNPLLWDAWPQPALQAPPHEELLPNGTYDGPFANHDCVNISSAILDWDALRNGLRTECSHTRHTRSLHCAGFVPGWQEYILPFLRLHQRAMPDEPLVYQAFEQVEAAAFAECPLGVITLNIARTIMCSQFRHVECYLHFTTWVSKELFKIPLTVFMGTDWPLFALLNSHNWAWPGIPPGNDYDCERGNHTTMQWGLMLKALQDDPSRPDASWWLDSLRYVFSAKAAADMYKASRECLYGVYVANIVKAMWAADTESSSYRIYAPYVRWVLYESLHLLGASNWRIFALMHHFTSLRRHGFRLDFTTKELGGVAFRGEGAWLQALPLDRHLGQLDLFNSWRPQFKAVVRALRRALEQAGPEHPRLVYVTMVYGSMNKYIPGWSRRLQLLGIKNLIMATLDDDAYKLCSEFHGEQCVQASISVLNKYTILLIALQLGVDVMWLDFDIFLVRNPTAAVVAAGEGYDILLGYDFSSDCICNGFFFLRSRPGTHRWLFELVRWLYDHPYEHDQRAISAFLNYTERTAASPEELPPLPRWHVFEVDNAFVNWGHWAGEYKELILVHFVDGSAFSLYGRPSWDPSIPDSKRLAGGASGATPSTSPLEAFYGSKAVTASPEEIWQVAPELRRLMDATIKPTPQTRQHCGILPAVESAHSGFGWLAKDGARAVPPPEFLWPGSS